MFNKARLLTANHFYKTNFDEALRFAVPSVYYEEDNSSNIKEIDIFDQLINSHLNIIGSISSVVYVSSISNTVFSSMNQPEGIAPFFVKQNNLTDIDTNDFERKILIPLDKSLRDFETSSEFSEYLTETLLPGIRTNSPTLDFLDGGSASANHNYLINNLSWMYLLNSGTVAPDYNPSSFVHDILISKIYNSQPILINDAMRGLTTFIWKNYASKASWQLLKVLPTDFRPPSFTQDDQYTSGTQQLDKLLTLVDILYSPLYIDLTDVRVKDAIEDYLQNQYTLTQKKNTGPFIKLLKAFSFAFADYNNTVDKLEILNDLTLCPDELLPKLADLIGWRLFGSEPDRWRLQLANAVDIYRKIGTKKSIQFAVDSILGQDVFDVSSSISELWESYIPHLIYYALATESSLLENFDTFTREVANSFGITSYSISSMDTNIRLCVDEIIYQICLLYRNKFFFNGRPFPLGSVDFRFNYRERVFPIPPFEEYPYYLNAHVTDDMADSIADKLVCFGVREEFALQVAEYIKNKILRTTDDLAINSGWLFFTSGVEYAPNWNSVIKDISNTRSEYLPLWSGKSSHFKLIFEASGFDFNKTSLEGDTSETIKIASQAAREFSPAHSVPDILALINDQEQYSNSHTLANFVNVNKVEQAALLTASSNGFSMFGNTAIAMSSYKRGLTASTVPTFSRGDVDSLTDSLVSPNGTTANIPRRAHRRRNLKNIIPKDGFYDRTGFNMPVSFQDYSIGDDSFLPLGFVPSSLQYVPITDYTNIPAIYNICENLNSSSVYNGVAVSNTYPVRGWAPLTDFD